MEPVKVNAWKFNTIIQLTGYSLIMRLYTTSLCLDEKQATQTYLTAITNCLAKAISLE